MRTLLAATIIGGVLVCAPPAQAGSVDWKPCRGQYECATLKVPAQRSKPAGAKVSLALMRHRSTSSDPIGSLVFNPGGPGGSGLDAIEWVWGNLSEEVKARFDLVTWDPRGIGASKPNLDSCGSVPLDLPATGGVNWAKVATAFVSDISTANAKCQKQRPKVVARMSTNENVADLDAIRVALGDPKLTYWGMSYGTRIGYVYALAHPDRVRAIVLDGSIDPAGTILGLAEGGAGPDQAFGAFTDAYPKARKQYNELLTRLSKAPVSLSGQAVFDRWALRDVVFSSDAQQSAYPGIADFLATAHAAVFDNDRAARRQIAAIVRSIEAYRLHNGNAGGAFAVTNCRDYAQRPSVADALPAIRQQVSLGPNVGGILATEYALGCAGLKVTPDPVPLITGRGSNVPVLILGASRDGSTVNSWTVRMSRAFPKSRTVTYAGGQHVTWRAAGSRCVDAVADAYVLKGTLPEADVGCPNAVTVE